MVPQPETCSFVSVSVNGHNKFDRYNISEDQHEIGKRDTTFLIQLFSRNCIEIPKLIHGEKTYILEFQTNLFSIYG